MAILTSTHIPDGLCASAYRTARHRISFVSLSPDPLSTQSDHSQPPAAATQLRSDQVAVAQQISAAAFADRWDESPPGA